MIDFVPFIEDFNKFWQVNSIQDRFNQFYRESRIFIDNKIKALVEKGNSLENLVLVEVMQYKKIHGEHNEYYVIQDVRTNQILDSFAIAFEYKYDTQRI